MRAAGAPTVVSDLVSDVRLRTGTLIHTDLEAVFRGRPVMLETKLDNWLPTGWSGTADWVIWNGERQAFVLGDLKTAKAEAMPWVLKEGVKESHQHQLSAYWYALRDMGIPLIHGYGVLYLPITQNPKEFVSPSWQEATPLDETYMRNLMLERWTLTEVYLAAVKASKARTNAKFLNAELVPVQERELRTYWNKAASKAGKKETPGVDVKLVPNWSTTYCDYPDDLCDCRHQKPVTLGHWMADSTGVRFTFSRGKDGMCDPADPAVQPSTKQIKELKEAYASSSQAEAR